MHLKLKEQVFVIDECSNKKIIARAKKLFTYIHPDLKKHGGIQKGGKTPKIEVESHEIIYYGTSYQLFSEVNLDLNKLCFTQNQILNFVEKYKNVSKDWNRLFLIKSHRRFVLIHVYFKGNYLGIDSRPLKSKGKWSALCCEVMAPKQVI